AGVLRGLISAGEQLDGELATAWAKQAELRARLVALEEMEQRYEHYPQGVRSVMAGAEYTAGICGVVAQMVEVPREYERAVAAVLRDKLEYIVVSGIEDGLNAVEYLRSAQTGRGSFIPVHPRHPNGHASGNGNGSSNGHLPVGEGIAPLLDLLTVDLRYHEVVEALLGDTLLVPDLRAGFQFWRQHKGHHTFVTPEGEIITAQGTVSGGSEGLAEEALLERRREIRVLREESERHEVVVATLTQRRQELKQQQQQLEDDLLRLEVETRALGQESEALQREEGKLDGDCRRLLDKHESVTYEQQTLESEQQALNQEIATWEHRGSELGVRRQERETALATAQAEVSQAKVALERQRTLADELRVRVAERRERQEGLRSQFSQLRDRQRELDDRLAACQEEMATAKTEIVHIHAGIAELSDCLTQNAAEQATAAGEQATQHAACERLRTQSHAYETRLEEIRAERTRLQEAKTRIEVSVAEKRVAREHLAATGQERYAVAIEEVLSQYTDDSLLGIEGETRRQELREKIARLGEVNPGAAAELAEAETRFTFLQSQETDLRRSLNDVQATITKLNHESRDRFRTTFAQVDAKFGEVYGRLVEGGKAQLALTNEEDLAESGVEITVQVPGKRLRSLQLLSGGEKALAALSFIFALFLIRPSPFCVLDEVDAPLDDANVGRFNQLLKEMSETTQIVLITHNKRTMEAANTLYGVTMQEPGVSTMVSVRVS
ncbi:MAG: hypothetical protein ACRERD_08000, partial [Candidatus Binatia bacterium]